MNLLMLLLIAGGIALIAFAIRSVYSNFRGFNVASAELAAVEQKISSHSGVDKLSETDLFDMMEPAASRPVTKSLSGHFRSMKRAASARSLASFDTDPGLRAFSAASMAGVTRVRAISGIVLIFGLVITLVNLQGAVGSLNRVLQEGGRGRAEHNVAKTLDPEALQTGMQGIAASATNAFKFSAFAIFMAALLLIGAMVQTGTAQDLNRRLASITSEITALAAVEEVKQSPEQVLRDLSEVINQFSEMARVFEKTNSGLEDLASFGTKFEASAELIGKAVDNLPKQIQTGMVSLSADVARGINEDLKHQLEYLKRIAAIYGDQQINITEIHQYMDRLTQQIEGSSAVIRQLEGTPEAIHGLAAAVSNFDFSSKILRNDLEQLDKKVAKFSVEEFAEAATELKLLSSALSPAIAELKDTASNLGSRVSSTMEATQRESAERLRSAIDGFVSELSNVLATGIPKHLGENTSKLLGEIKKLEQMLESGESNGRSNGISRSEIQKQLAHITTELNRVPKWRL